MPVVGLLPLWVLLYAWALKPPEKVVAGPLGEGKTVFATCASCHGSTGGGGVGRQLSNGEVLKTFPKFEDQASLVYTGSAPYAGKVYGDPNRPGGPHQGGSFNGSFMPQQGEKFGGALTDAEIIAVVCHERFTTRRRRPARPEVRAGVRRLVRAGRAQVRGGRAPASRRSTKRASARRPRPEQPVPSTRSYDVLVVGGGPAGASAAYWLARPATTSPSSSARRSRARRPAATA